LPDFFARNHLTRTLQQNYQNLLWLAAQLDANAMLAELAGAEIYLKGVEAQDAACIGWTVRSDVRTISGETLQTLSRTRA
jgi:hypothetical protein